MFPFIQEGSAHVAFVHSNIERQGYKQWSYQFQDQRVDKLSLERKNEVHVGELDAQF